jgi:UDP-N-acetylglucosamine acyltransferase
MSIHPTALVDPTAEIHETAEIGPYVVIEKNVRIGAGTRLMPFVHICEGVTIGENNKIHSHAVIGDAPQHLAYDGGPRRTVIGDHNDIREYVTVHRSYAAEGETRIGNRCLLMVNSHVGHDSIIGDNVILTNGALLAGHVTVMDRAIISGNCGVHQFVRIGRFAMMQGLAGVSKDVPPYMIMATGMNTVAGINVIGLRRAGFSQEARNQIKQAYRILFRQGNSVPSALAKIKACGFGPEVQEIITFIEGSKRGICTQGRRGATQDEE